MVENVLAQPAMIRNKEILSTNWKKKETACKKKRKN